MNRLFWKFFMFLLVAQLTAVTGVSVAIWLQHRHEALQSTGVEISPPARSLVEAASSTLQFGGVDALKHLLKSWQKRPMPPLLAIDNNGKELLERSYSKASFDTALALVREDQYQRHVKRIELGNGQSFLLFVPDNGRNAAPNLAPNPPERNHGQPSITANTGLQPHDTVEQYRGAPRKPRARFPTMPLMGGVVVSFLFAALLAWYFSKPINILRSAFEQASHGKLDVRVANAMGGRRDELSDLGHDFDAMASRLESLLQSQTKLLHHVSHELRSPLARMQMALGLITQSPHKMTEFIERITLEANRMDGLIGELLTLSRLESGTVQIKKETLALNLYSIVEDAQFEAASKDIKLRMEIEHEHSLEGQADLLYRAIENVVRNAIKYGPNHSVIHINCYKDTTDASLHIVVTDEGAGVDALELEDIFKPFVRGISGSQTVGHGVGLAITKQVIEAHSGHVSAHNLNPTGFCVEITLPC